MGVAPSSAIVASKDDAHHAELRASSFNLGDMSAATEFFTQNGFVIFQNVLDTSVCQHLDEKFRAVDWVSVNDFNRRDEDGGRFSMAGSESWYWPGTWAMLEQPYVYEFIQGAFQDPYRRIHITKIAGDGVRGNVLTNQEIHSDGCGLMRLKYNPKIVDKSPACIAVSYAVHDIGIDQAPMRITTWDQQDIYAEKFGSTPPSEDASEFLPMLRVAVPLGWCIIRDVRVWHSGTANRTDQTRILPGYAVCSQTMMRIGHPYSYRPARTLPSSLWDDAQRRKSIVSKNLDYVYSAWS